MSTFEIRDSRARNKHMENILNCMEFLKFKLNYMGKVWDMGKV